MTNLQIFGAVIRAERDARGLSQEGLADLAHMSRSHIGEIERGEVNLSFHALIDLATGLGMALSELIKQYELRRKY